MIGRFMVFQKWRLFAVEKWSYSQENKGIDGKT